MSAFEIKFDAEAILGKLDGVQKVVEAAVRPSAQAGSQELYYEALLRVPESLKAHYFYGKNSKKTGVRYLFNPGDLRKAIYQVYSKDHSGKARATYHISWNHQKVPYGFMVEFGTSRAAPHSFIRKSYESRGDFALRVVHAEMTARVKEAL